MTECLFKARLAATSLLFWTAQTWVDKLLLCTDLYELPESQEGSHISATKKPCI